MPENSHISERDAIYGAVGRALDAWTKIEVAIEPLFATLADANAIKGAAAMASITSFKARVGMCHTLVAQSQASRELRAKWRALFNKLNNIYSERNEIAHFSVIDWRNTDTGITTTCLIPYFSGGGFTKLHSLAFDKVMKAKNEREADRLFDDLPSFKSLGMSSADILKRSGEFDALAAEVHQIVSDFVEAKKQAEEAREHLQHLIQSADNPDGHPRPE